MSKGLFDRISFVVKKSARRKERKIAEIAGYSLMNYHHSLDFAERSLLLQGRIASRDNASLRSIQNLGDVEFRVFSQWGEDGIIDWLVQHVALPNKRFVEFGVENFKEANCRFLLQNRNWRGLVLDGSDANMAALKSDRLFWMYDVTARAAFVTAENIDSLIQGAGFGGPLGILSIDIDGNDYWVWDAIKCVDPAIVICEYNPILGDTRPVVVPYASDFQRFNAHYSGLYFGASIAALKRLAEKKGYVFVGTNTNGINAFFVRKDLAAPVLSALEEIKAFPSRHRDSRDEAGNLSFAAGLERFDLIAAMSVIDLDSGLTVSLGSLENPYSAEWLAGME